jgi:hypothetical protein
MKMAMIQPGKIGDVIICIPIASYYHKQGHSIVWPVLPYIAAMMQPVVPYVKFIPIPEILWTTAVEASAPAVLINPLFGFGGNDVATADWKWSGQHFDEHKYARTYVPFEEKFKLKDCIVRNTVREEALFKQVYQKKPFTVVHEFASDGSRAISKSINKSHVISITNLTDSVFDWLLVLERADSLHMLDSCMVNLACQMGVPQKNFRYRRPGYPNDIYYPVLTPNWTTIE